ncbi:WD repeat-containing protein 53 [Cichlidogyrus casuarinus]|uniref:WD repeat-containing protein 53 n=1 Tax=Cichlidogyrus casuarinus TaxID=1844966 RepID=A0ABD2PZ59_9PLAT
MIFQITIQTLGAFLLLTIGIANYYGNYKEIDATAEFNNKSNDSNNYRATFCTFNHRNFRLGHHDSVTALALSDHHQLASGSDDACVCLWLPAQSSSPINKISLENPVTDLIFSHNKPDLIYVAHGGSVASFDLRNSSAPLFNHEISPEEINSLHLLESESRLAVGDDNGAVQILSADNGSLLRTLKKHDNICSVVHFRPNRNWQIISGGLDCRLVVSDWKESGRGVSIFEMSELLDFPDEDSVSVEDDEELEEEEEEEEQDAASAGSSSSVRHRTSYSSNQSVEGPWSTTSEETEAPHQVRIHASQRTDNAFVAAAMSTGYGGANRGMPVNPPMIHSLAASTSGHLVAVGLASTSVELFLGEGKHLVHSESLYGHSRGVSALHMIEDDQFLLSGGNDKSIFVWPLAGACELGEGVIEGSQFTHTDKLEAIRGKELTRVYVADAKPFIKVLDLSHC